MQFKYILELLKWLTAQQRCFAHIYPYSWASGEENSTAINVAKIYDMFQLFI